MYFSRNHNIVSLPAIFLDCLAHNLFTLAAGIAFGAIEEIDSNIVCSFHARKCILCDHLSMCLRQLKSKRWTHHSQHGHHMSAILPKIWQKLGDLSGRGIDIASLEDLLEEP